MTIKAFLKQGFIYYKSSEYINLKLQNRFQINFRLKPINQFYFMDFQFRKKPNLKPLSRKKNYLSNIRDDSPVSQNRINSGSIQVTIIQSGFNHPKDNIISEEEQLQNVPIINMTRSISQIDQEERRNSKNIIQELHSKVRQESTFRKNAKVEKSKVQIQNNIELTFDAIDTLFMNLSEDKSKAEAVKLLLEKVQQILGLKEAQVADDTLHKLLTKQLLKDESKIYIASKSLITSLIIIKFFNKKDISKQLMINPFIIMNDINKGVLAYLKSKYPRNKNLFVPTELQSKFDQVNYLTLHENNMLVNMGLTFTKKNASRAEILGKTKKFLNLIMDEIDSRFHDFEALLNQKVFKLAEQHDLRKNKIKIGRKIPENTEKFYEFKSQNLEISSPQLFRVMIKWIGSMEELLMNPSKIITKLSSLKYLKKTFGQTVIFDEIQSRRFEDLKIQIIEKIANMKDFKKKFQKLINKLNTFNSNFAKTLDARSPSTKFIREEQAETMKFAKFNTLFLQWLIVQKFLVIIKAFSQLSSFFEGRYYKKFDFINFNVFDLMRASFSGKKNQILQVFENLKQLDKSDEIQLVRIKNRLNTPLNDVMINFKMKDCFIICELQLILVDILQEGEEKLKLAQELNHIIYELERSPYGSLSEMALIMGYYDPTIQYESKIYFKDEWEMKNFCKTGKLHEFQEIEDQQTPFVCSWCVKFYGRLVNFFEYQQCINCSLQKCKACYFKENLQEQKRVYFKYFASCFQNLSLEVIDNEKDDDFIDNFFIRDDSLFIHDRYQKVRDHILIDGKTKLDQLESLLYHKKTQEYSLKATQPFFALLLQFSNGQYSLIVIKYVNYKVDVCTQMKVDEKGIRLQEHDALFFFRKRVYYNNKKQSDTYLDRIPASQAKKMVNIVGGTPVKGNKKKNYEAVYIFHNNKKYFLEWVKVGNDHEVDNIEKITRVVSKTIEKCQSYKAERNCIELHNLNLSVKHLRRIKEKDWIKDVRVLNLTENQITEAASIIKSFMNLKELYLTKNRIRQFELVENSQLQIIDISDNELFALPDSIHFATKLTVLKAATNYISEYPVLDIISLEELDLSLNQINSVKKLFTSKIKNLIILNISFNKIDSEEEMDWSKVRSFPQLRRIQANKVNLDLNKPLKLSNFPKLQYIDYSQNVIRQLETFSQKSLREIKLYHCQITSLKNILTDKLINLEILQLYSNKIEQLPKLELNDLEILKLNNNRIKSIENIRKSYLPKLRTLDLQSNLLTNINELALAELPHLRILLLKYNQIQQIPVLNLPELQVINFVSNKVKDAQKISESNLPVLRQILLKQNKLKKLPAFNLPALSQMNLTQNQIDDLSKFKDSTFSNVKKLSLWKNKIKEIPPINFPTIESMLFFDNKIQSIVGLSDSHLNRTTIISLYNNQIKSLPIIKFPALEKFYIYKNKLADVESLRHWETPSLRILDMNSNDLTDIPPLSFQSLIELEISYNKIQSLSNFCENSYLPNLRKFFANANQKLSQIRRFDRFVRLEQIQINDCSLEDFDQLAKSNLMHLRKISFQKNKILSIPHLHFKQLQELILRNNCISEIKFSFKRVKKLKKLYISNNEITQIHPQPFEDCSITQISLNENPLKKIQFPQSLNVRNLIMKRCGITSLNGLYMPNVRELYLKENLLSDLQFLNEPGAFVNLKKLYVEGNKIKSLPCLDLPQLSELIIFNNPLEERNEILGSFLPNMKKLLLHHSGVKSVQNIPEMKNIESLKVFESEEEEQQEPNRQITSLITPEETVSKKQQTQKQVFVKEFKQMFPKTIVKI